MSNEQPVVRAIPTIEELRKAYEEGLEIALWSGIKVKMHPIQPEQLLLAGDIPDMLSPLLLHSLFPPEEPEYRFADELDDFINQPLDSDINKRLDFVKSVNMICRSALVEPQIADYLSFVDRLWCMRLAFYPVEVLSRFRDESAGDVDAVADKQESQQTEQPTPRNGSVGEAEPVRAVPV